MEATHSTRYGVAQSVHGLSRNATLPAQEGGHQPRTASNLTAEVFLSTFHYIVMLYPIIGHR